MMNTESNEKVSQPVDDVLIDETLNIEDDTTEHASIGDVASITLNITWRKNTFDLDFAEDATPEDVFAEIEETLGVRKANQKILVPKGPMLKYPPKDTNMSLKPLVGKKLTLMGCSAAELEAVDLMSEKIAHRNRVRLAQRAKAKTAPRKTHGGVHVAEEAKYTFLQVKPLDWLPRSERSHALLMKLKTDPGIKSVMRKRKFTVGLLTEMEPLQHTQSSHEGVSRTLGLNRNKGQVIELRLRTDAHDGYRDYKTIRKTLCHELTHNVHSEHDRQFWDLCGLIEKEVEAADWKSGGHTIGESSRYTISGAAGLHGDDDDESADTGGWTGGEFVLGSSGSKATETKSWDRREILARAAMERQKKDEQSECQAEKGWRPCQRPHPSDEPQ